MYVVNYCQPKLVCNKYIIMTARNILLMFTITICFKLQLILFPTTMSTCQRPWYVVVNNKFTFLSCYKSQRKSQKSRKLCLSHNTHSKSFSPHSKKTLQNTLRRCTHKMAIIKVAFKLVVAFFLDMLRPKYVFLTFYIQQRF